MLPPRREVTPPGRYLVAARSESSEEEARGTARMLGLAPGAMRDIIGAGWPRVIASRSTWEDAESLVRVLTARGREAIAWDSEAPLVELFHAERLLVEGGQLILEQQDRTRRTYPADQLQRIVDLRLRAKALDGSESSWLRARDSASAGRGEFPERALLIVPLAGWGTPGVLSTRTAAVTGPVRAPLLVAQRVQEAAVRVRTLAPDKCIEMRTNASALGVEEAGRDPLGQMLQLLARLPPTPVLPGR